LQFEKPIDFSGGPSCLVTTKGLTTPLIILHTSFLFLKYQTCCTQSNIPLLPCHIMLIITCTFTKFSPIDSEPYLLCHCFPLANAQQMLCLFILFGREHYSIILFWPHEALGENM
jgi:hypothetical protein